MKRLMIAVLIVCIILISGIWSLWQFSLLKEKAIPIFDQMEEAAKQENFSAATVAAQQFLELWLSYEGKLIPFVRRDPLEAIGSCAARLPSLSEHEDVADYAAAVQELRYRFEELWESEIPMLRNLI